MYVDHPGVYRPKSPEAKIWRFMRFAQLASLVQRRALWFTQVARFSDPFEGSLPRASIESWQRVAAQTRLENPTFLMPSMDQFLTAWAGFRAYTYANCWHANEQESAAMWTLHARDDHGVAITSTVRRLADSILSGAEPHYVGAVRYIDYARDEGDLSGVNKPVLTKRLSFEHEHEIRALVSDWPMIDRIHKTHQYPPNDKPGRYVAARLETLIENVLVAPKAQGWLREAVEWLLVNSGFPQLVPVQHSALDAVPY